nr:MAG TPA: hypothetical protein [Bacteriophage sp.]
MTYTLVIPQIGITRDICRFVWINIVYASRSLSEPLHQGYLFGYPFRAL